MKAFAPLSLRRLLADLQYGQYDLEKTAASHGWSVGCRVEDAEHGGLHIPTELLSMISCALVLAAMIVFGLAERAPLKKLRRKLMVGEWEGGIG